ncbi:MAG TPA: CARDB domain-containing protein [Thermoanaerobaculia bacterium]|nr:CARDB domain-containing protein [Thermoanaerobaculia bacterium]
MSRSKSGLAAVAFLFLATSLAAQTADVSVTIVGYGSPTAGSSAVYDVHIKNFGPDAASGTLTGSYPSVVTSAYYSGGCTVVPPNCQPSFNLAAGEEKLLTLYLELDPALEEGTSLTTRVEAVTSTTDPNSSNNADTITTSVTTKAELGLQPSGSNTVPSAPGQSFDWHFTVHNSGPSVARNVVLTADLDAVSFDSLTIDPALDCLAPAAGSSGTLHCTAATLLPGDYAGTMTVHAPQSGNGTIAATISSSTPDPLALNNHYTATLQVKPAVFLRREISGPSSTAAGTTFTDSVTITNDGPGDAPNVTVDFRAHYASGSYLNVAISSNSGVQVSCTNVGTVETCTAPLLRNGESATLSFDTTVPVNAPNAAEIVADVSVSTADAYDTNNVGTLHYSTFVGSPTNDISVQKSGPAVITAGETVSYDITIANAGPQAAAADWSDFLPFNSLDSVQQIAGVPLTCATHVSAPNILLYWVQCSGAMLQPGESSTVRIFVKTSPRPSEVQATNVVTAATSGDANRANDSSSVTSQVVAAADLSVAMSGPATARPGEHIAYTIDVAQNGVSAATSVTLTDTLPQGATLASPIHVTGGSVALDCSGATPGSTGTVTCTLSEMAPGQTSTLEVEIFTSASASGNVTNSASISSAVPDPNGGNNTAEVTTQMQGGGAMTDLGVTAAGPSAVAPDQTAHYAIQVSNGGPADATHAVVEIIAPAGTTVSSFGAAAGTPFNCAKSGDRSIRCTAETFPSGATAAFDAALFMGSAGNRSLFVTVSANEGDMNPANNVASVTTLVGNAPLDVAVVMTASPQRQVLGGEVIYDVVVSAGGTGSAGEVTLTDVVPSGLKFIAATPSQGTCSSDGPVVCRLGTLASGASATVRLRLTAAAAGTIRNEIVAAASSPEANGANNRAAADVTVVMPRRRAAR